MTEERIGEGKERLGRKDATFLCRRKCQGFFKKGQISSQPGSGFGQNGVDAGLIVSLEKGEELMAEAISEKDRVRVTLVGSKRDLALLEVAKNVDPFQVKEWPNHVTMLWAHRRKSLHTRATEETEEERFGLVILMVGDRNKGGVLFSSYFLKESVAEIAKLFLEVGN